MPLTYDNFEMCDPKIQIISRSNATDTKHKHLNKLEQTFEKGKEKFHKFFNRQVTKDLSKNNSKNTADYMVGEEEGILFDRKNNASIFKDLSEKVEDEHGCEFSRILNPEEVDPNKDEIFEFDVQKFKKSTKVIEYRNEKVNFEFETKVTQQCRILEIVDPTAKKFALKREGLHNRKNKNNLLSKMLKLGKKNERKDAIEGTKVKS